MVAHKGRQKNCRIGSSWPSARTPDLRKSFINTQELEHPASVFNSRPARSASCRIDRRSIDSDLQLVGLSLFSGRKLKRPSVAVGVDVAVQLREVAAEAIYQGGVVMVCMLLLNSSQKIRQEDLH